jgi:prepilin-type N-terminal cleavage/methylation domain-containing protein
MAYNKAQRGDTLVEVLMAIVLISVVIVGSMTMMSRGLSAAQVAMEHSQVRLSVNGQIEMLRFARDSYLASPTSASGVQWQAIITASNANAITYDATCNITGGKQGFYLSKNAAQVNRNNYTPSTPATVSVPGSGMWIESVLSPTGTSPAFADFVIRACWQGSGSAGQQRTVTAVRLYDPTR